MRTDCDRTHAHHPVYRFNTGPQRILAVPDSAEADIEDAIRIVTQIIAEPYSMQCANTKATSFKSMFVGAFKDTILTGQLDEFLQSVQVTLNNST